MTESRLQEELLLLYELSLSIGKSFDVRQLARDFLKTLMARKNLSSASIWWEDPPTPYWTLIDAIPRETISFKKLLREHALCQLALKGNVCCLNRNDAGFSWFDINHIATNQSWAICPLGRQGMLLMSSTAKDFFTRRMMGQFRAITQKLNYSISGAKAHQQIRESESTLIRQTQELKTSQALLRNIIDNAPMQVFWKDSNLRYQGCNPHFASEAGLNGPEEIIGKNDSDLWWAVNADQHEVAEQRVIDSGEGFFGHEESFVLSDGTVKWLRISKVPLINNHQQVYGLVGIYQDITHNRLLQSRLEEGLEQYYAAINTSSLGFWMTNTDGQILEVNEACLRQSGYSKAELLQMNIFQLHENSGAYDQGYARHLLEKRAAHYCISLRRKDGSTWPVETKSTYSAVQGGRFFYFFDDISDKVAVEKKLAEYNDRLEMLVEKRTEELIDARDEAERANQAKSEFLSRMSHELRTPLNAILGFAQVQKLLDSNDYEQQHQCVDRTIEAGTHLLSLINDILDIVKFEQDRMELVTESCDITKIVEESLHLIEAAAREKQVSIETELESRYVIANAKRLKQVVVNLLTNAIKYNRVKGKVVVKVKRVDEKHIEIGIQDSGVGIDQEELHLIFEPFTRLAFAQKNEIEGSGIGLAISKYLVEQMQGSITVESALGRGSTFYLRFNEDQRPLVSEQSHSTRYAEENLVSKTVVYIEDNVASQQLMKMILKKYRNVRLFIASTGEEGIELVRETQPDLIFLDLNLPKMSGLQTFEVLRSQVNQSVRVVALSADALPDQVEHTLAQGLDGYITKPLNIQDVLAAVFDVS